MAKGETETTSRPYTRRALDPFDDPRVEDYCKARAKGTTIKASGNYAGIAYPTAMSWEKRPEVKERVRELREGAETISLVSVAYIMNGLKKNVEEARSNGQYKASNEALKILYELIKSDKDALGGGLALGNTHSPAAVRDALRNALSRPGLPETTAPSVDQVLESEGELVEADSE